MVIKNKSVARKYEDKMDWRRVEELLAEKLADRVKINLKIRENEEELEEDFDDDEVEEEDHTPEEVDEKVSTRDVAYFFIHRHMNKTDRVG